MPSTVHGTLAALADETRQTVVDFLSKEPRRASDIAAALGLTAQAMSRHLRVLRCGGLFAKRESKTMPASAATASGRNHFRNSAAG